MFSWFGQTWFAGEIGDRTDRRDPMFTPGAVDLVDDA